MCSSGGVFYSANFNVAKCITFASCYGACEFENESVKTKLHSQIVCS